MPLLPVGETAPDFDLPAVTGEEKHRFRLSELRGQKHVVLAFYPLDWTPTWSKQMPAYNRDLERFAGLGAQVVGVSVDSVFSHIAWQKRDIGVLRYPLCSDFYPHGETAKKYGAFREGDPIPGITERAVFIVDKAGKIAFSKVYDLGQEPPNQDCFEVLSKL